MGIDVAKILGLDPNQVKQGQNAIATITEDIACMRADIAALTRLMSYHYGKARQDHNGYDPAALPGVKRVQPAAGETKTIDFRALLSKPASSGFIKNIGPVDVELVYLKANQGSDGTTKSNTYILTVSETLPIDGLIDAIEITTPAAASAAGDVQTNAR